MLCYRYDGFTNYPDLKRTVKFIDIYPTADCPYLTWEFLNIFDLEEDNSAICFSTRENDVFSIIDQSGGELRYCGTGLPASGYSNDNVNSLQLRFNRDGDGSAGVGFKIRICQFGNMCDWFTSSTTTCKTFY